MKEITCLQGRLVIGLSQIPERAKWRRHVAIDIYNPENDVKKITPLFSVASVRMVGEALVEVGALDENGLNALLDAAIELGLPFEATREDRIVQSQRENHAQLLDIVSGTVPPQPGSGPAQFVVCGPGSKMFYPDFPKHVMLRIENTVNAFVGTPVISTAGARRAVEIGIEVGGIAPEDENRLYGDIHELGLIETNELTRADRLALSGRGDLEKLLAFDCGKEQPNEPARIKRCGDHAHFYAYDDMPFAMIPLLPGLPIAAEMKFDTITELTDAINLAFEQGVIVASDRDRLLSDAAASGLPLTEKDAKHGGDEVPDTDMVPPRQNLFGRATLDPFVASAPKPNTQHWN